MGQSKLMPSVLTIAGSDSGCGAGIQMDLKVFQAFAVHGCSAITAVTAQNPCEVSRIDSLPAPSVIAQIDAVFDKFPIRAVKTGMLFRAETISAVVSRIKMMPGNVMIVVDPVMVATSGAVLMRPEAVKRLRTQLIAECDWLTPNIPEAEIISQMKIRSMSDMIRSAKTIGEKFSCSCIVKGGHSLSRGKKATDIVFHNKQVYELSSDIVDVGSSHGTGCAFSAALTAGLALHRDWKDALVTAKRFVFSSLKQMTSLGRGLDVLNTSIRPHGKTVLKRIVLS